MTIVSGLLVNRTCQQGNATDHVYKDMWNITLAYHVYKDMWLTTSADQIYMDMWQTTSSRKCSIPHQKIHVRRPR